MTLYTKSGSYPSSLPHRIRLSSGFTRTDPSQFTEEDIADAGYIPAPLQPEYDSETQRLDWNGSDWDIVETPPAPINPTK